MVDFTSSPHCVSRAHCFTCRTDSVWRGKVNAPEQCPFGITPATIECLEKKLNCSIISEMNVIRDTTVVPDEGWKYPSVDGKFLYTRNYGLLYGLVKDHYEANGQSVPSPQDVVDWLCANTYLSCYDDQTREPLINRWTQGLAPVTQRCCGK